MTRLALTLIGLLTVPLLFPQAEQVAASVAPVAVSSITAEHEANPIDKAVDELITADRHSRMLDMFKQDQAAIDRTELDSLRRQIAELNERYDELAAENRELQAERMKAVALQEQTVEKPAEPTRTTYGSRYYYVNTAQANSGYAACNGANCSPRGWRSRRGMQYAQ